MSGRRPDRLGDREREQLQKLLALAHLNDQVDLGHGWQRLAGDGSDRLFYRLTLFSKQSIIAVLPPDRSPRMLAEAGAAARIGRHLRQCGVPVPSIPAWDPASGGLLCQDLGDCHFSRYIRELPSPAEKLAAYRRLLDILMAMQIDAAAAFPVAACWESSHYDRRIMRRRESDYFLDACVGGSFQLKVADRGRLVDEFEQLAGCCARQPNGFFLHRDFQSRNILVNNDRFYIIDFQGGRLGPLGYDLASLLLDPYVGLSPDQQEMLLRYYVEQMAKLQGFSGEVLVTGYRFLALQRLMQMLGAFCFLSRVKGKKQFARYVAPTLWTLSSFLTTHLAGRFPCLTDLVARLCSSVPAGEGGQQTGI